MTNEKSDFAYKSLYNLIIYQKWAPGEIHSVSEVATKLKISRTPVTEAVNRLESEGLVKILPRKGFIVNAADPEELREIFEIKSVIEGLAAKKAAENQTAEKRKILESIISAQEQSVQEQNVTALSQYDLDLHFAIFHLSNSPMLEKMAISLWHKGHSYVDWTLDWSLLRTIFEEHQILVAAIIDGRADEARSIMEQHSAHYLKCLLLKNSHQPSYGYEEIRKDPDLAEKLLTTKLS